VILELGVGQGINSQCKRKENTSSLDSSSCENGNKHLVKMKGGEIIDELSDY
jgi:hypothetical protein